MSKSLIISFFILYLLVSVQLLIMNVTVTLSKYLTDCGFIIYSQVFLTAGFFDKYFVMKFYCLSTLHYPVGSSRVFKFSRHLAQVTGYFEHLCGVIFVFQILLIRNFVSPMQYIIVIWSFCGNEYKH